jgi:competence ComEA-like helix-hairpin-helix protein
VKEYIAITATNNNHYNNNANRPAYNPNAYAEEKKARLTVADINTTDTTALIALPGIGSKLAYRIINFRDKLGGFHSVDQVGETYGLPDSTFQKIKPYLNINPNAVRKININTATKDELKAHPYIRWQLANAIVEYRNQHGTYKSIDDLRNIVLIDEATLNKIAPYLSL